MAWITHLDRVGLCFYLQNQLDDILEFWVRCMRDILAAKTYVVTDLVFVVDDIKPDPGFARLSIF